jgi:TorA maturation chaperone TorD
MTENHPQTSLDLDTNLSPEDLARADLYGLLALLFYEAPATELLEKIAQFGQDVEVGQQDESSLLHGPWQDLVEMAKDSRAQDWQEDYENAFIGVGKQEIFLYGSYYLTGFLNEKPLAKGELQNIIKTIPAIELVDTTCKRYEELGLKHLSYNPEEKLI